MLTPADVARYLPHDTKEVRDHALRSLALAGERSEVKADVPLAILGQLGVSAFTDPALIAQLLPSPEAATKAFAAAGGAASPVRAIASALLQELPANLLLANRDLVGTLPAGALRTRLEQRLALAQQPAEKLWQRLLASADAAESHDLVLALIPHDAAIAPLIAALLSRNVPASGESAAIELAGRIHLATAVNVLVDRLARPEATVAEAAAVALGRLGTAGAATILEQRCNLASATAWFRLHAARAMSRFRIPSVEATLLRLLVEEDDQAALCALCTALADMCTTTGFPRLCEIVSAGRCGDQTPVLKRSISALDTMLRAVGSKSAATHHAPPPAATAPAPAPLPAAPTGGPILSTLSPSDFSSLDVTDPELAPPADDLPLMEIPDEAPAPAPAAPAQLRRDANQVGRNDPCPCGSGKKYKKCCGA